MKNNFCSLQEIYSYYLQSPYISIDSRKDVSNTIFFALRGDCYDGNSFAGDALAKGAAYVVIDNPQYYINDKRCLLVGNTLVTLQQLAQLHRQELNIPIIAITGSNGKTTTKELLYAVLSQRYNSFATQGNLNNHIGVPISILSINKSTEIAVIEMGANHVGEIAQLCKIAQPTHGLITNIGAAHIEGFGGIEGVKRGKGELYTYLKEHGGTPFINSTDATLMEMGKIFLKPILYPQDTDFYYCELLEAKPYITYKSEENQFVTTHLVGQHHFYNIAAALCVGKYFGVPSQAAHSAIQAYAPSNNRSQIVKKGSNTILLDAYNANPSSMRAALDAFDFFIARQKVVILGDMNELGEEAIIAHQAIVKLTAERNYQQVILYGKHMATAQASNPHALHFTVMNDLEDYLKSQQFIDTAILIKASNSYHLERLLDFINDDKNV